MDDVATLTFLVDNLSKGERERLADLLSMKACEILKGEPMPANVIFAIHLDDPYTP